MFLSDERKGSEVEDLGFRDGLWEREVKGIDGFDNGETNRLEAGFN
jgi:hypothetical protein